jgi:biopolymer transport protein ExbB/TolQ
MIERYIVIQRLRWHTKKFKPEFLELVKKKRIQEAISSCEDRPTIVTKMFVTVLERGKAGPAVLASVFEREGSRITMAMEKRLSILASMGSTTPFIGLFGTVVGIMKTFNGMASIAQSPALVTNGIAEALLNTAAGLFVAIPAVVAYNFFAVLIRRFMQDLELYSSEILDLLSESKSS